MGAYRMDYILFGWKLPNKISNESGDIDLWDDKYLPYIEGHKGIEYSIVTDPLGEYTAFGKRILHNGDSSHGSKGVDYINNAIDHKVINIIKDMLIEFEDIGCEVDIVVSDKVSHGEVQDLDSTIIYKNGKVPEFVGNIDSFQNIDNGLFDKIMNKELVYDVDIISLRFLGVDMNEFLDRFLSYVSVKNFEFKDHFNVKTQRWVCGLRFELDSKPIRENVMGENDD